MMRHRLPWIVLAAMILPVARADEERPNIVVILADDFGYGSLGCYGGGGLKTPNLDRLAREGRKFTQAYCPGSVCSPTRYGLMTGRYYWRTSVKDGEVLPGNAPLHIETTRLTLGSLCKGRGYRTAAIGKWHLGLQSGVSRTDWNRPLEPGPLEVGFDSFFGLAANPWNGPHNFIEDHEITHRIPGQPIVVTPGREEATTSGITRPWRENEIMKGLTDRAVAWVEQDREKPFFLYFAPNAVHRPVAPNPAYSGSKYGIYGDFIAELDGSVGRILETLDRLRIADHTLIIFTSDNGGVINRMIPETAFALDAGLAVNGPLRGGKHDIWEGGFRVPFLVRWPGHVPEGTVSDQVICLTDVLATLADILHAPLPAGNAEDSFNVHRAFTESQPGPPVRDHVVLQDAHGTYAIRAGDWKLIERTDTPPITPRNKAAAKKMEKAKQGEPKHDELFDLARDLAESTDQHAAQADLAKQLKRKLMRARDEGSTRPGAGR